MTKKLVLAVGTAAVFSILAGCTTYDRAASYVNEPVVSDVKVGMTVDHCHTGSCAGHLRHLCGGAARRQGANLLCQLQRHGPCHEQGLSNLFRLRFSAEIIAFRPTKKASLARGFSFFKRLRPEV
jgi:hypothetical protein